MSAIQGRAESALACFETATRPEGESFRRVKEGSPDWVSDLVREAHGDFLPDDWRYDCIHAALDFIAVADYPEDGAGEFADGHVDVYNAARVAWLGSSIHRGAFCDEALAEYGADVIGDAGVYGVIGLGQYAEANEVYGLVLQQLQEENSCPICSRPADDGYVNELAAERCVDACHSATRLHAPRAEVA